MTANFVDVIDRRRAWRGHPGLWDPLAVVEICLADLTKEVFANIGWHKIDVESNRPPAYLREVCPGVQRYLQSWPPLDPALQKQVRDYIAFPCYNKLRAFIGRNKTLALQFLFEYLRIRGPFLNLNVDKGSLERAEFSFRYMINAATYHLKRMPTLDFCAALLIGRYLHNLNQVACTHRMFFFREVIARHFGPHFLKFNIKADLKEELDSEHVEKTSVALFAALIDTLPWEQFQPFEGVSVCVFPSPERNLRRSNDDLDDYVLRCRQIPEDILKELEPCFQSTKTADQEPGELKVKEAEELDPNKAPFESDKPFPPDKCDLTMDGGLRSMQMS